jgi:transposase
MASKTPIKSHQIKVLYWWNQGVRSATTIARKTKVPLSTVHDNLKKLKNNGNLDRKKGSGRKRLITKGHSQAIGQYLRRNNELTAKGISTKIEYERGLKVSDSTINRHLKKLNYKSVLPTGTPMLTEYHKQLRVEWAKKHKGMNWNRVIFSDESSFQLFRNTIKRWSKNWKKEKKCVPKNRQKIHCWGGFSIKGLIGIHTFKRIMDGPYYTVILKNHMLVNAKKQFGTRWTFQQDNDPKHTSKVAKKFFEDENIIIMEWPSNSPDINPIENLWSIIKRRIEKRKPRNIKELETFIIEEWNKIDSQIIMNLVNSMDSRLKAVIEAKGERINY